MDNNIIKFPKHIKEKQLSSDKIEVAYKLLQAMNDEGIDFQIIVSRKDAEKVFDTVGKKDSKYVNLTTNYDKSQEIFAGSSMVFFIIEGDEL